MQAPPKPHDIHQEYLKSGKQPDIQPEPQVNLPPYTEQELAKINEFRNRRGLEPIHE